MGCTHPTGVVGNVACTRFSDVGWVQPINPFFIYLGIWKAYPMDHEMSRKNRREGQQATIVGLMVDGFLVVLKLMAGIWGHSQALVADAVHSLSDIFTDAVVMVGLHVGRKPPDIHHHFGHGRIETLTSVIVGLVLLLTAIYLGIEAVFNIYHHVEYHPTILALLAAAVSIGAKELLYHYTNHVGKKIKSRLIIANAWNHRSDGFSSVAVLIGVAGAIINPAWHILDSYATLIVSFFILKIGMDSIKASVWEISDAAPSPEVTQKITTCSLDVEGVKDTHDIRIRSLGGLYQIEIHIVVDGELSVTQGHRIAKEVEKCLFEEVQDIGKIIIHVDPAVL